MRLVHALAIPHYKAVNNSVITYCAFWRTLLCYPDTVIWYFHWYWYFIELYNQRSGYPQ